jgi:hypothetical protein
MGEVAALVASQRQRFYDRDAYPTLSEKAAIIMFSAFGYRLLSPHSSLLRRHCGTRKWSSSAFGVTVQEVPKDHQELAGVVAVPAIERLVDVVAYHVTDLLGTLWLFQQVSSHRSGSNLGHMFVLCNGAHLLLGQSTQGDAVLKRNHVMALHWLHPNGQSIQT